MVLVHYTSQYYRYIMCNDMLTCYFINLNHFATMVFSVRTAQRMMRGHCIEMSCHCAMQTMVAKMFKFIM